MLLANPVRGPQTSGKLRIVFPQLRQHVQGINIFCVIIKDALNPGDMPNGSECRPPNFAHALCYRVSHRVKLIRVFVQQQVAIAKMRAAHMPVKILGFNVECKDIGENGIHCASDVFRGFG